MRPVRVDGPRDSWQPLLREMEASGACVLYAGADGWAGPGPRPGPSYDGAERRRLERLRRPLLRERFTASRALLKSAAAAVLGVEPGDLELAREPGGRPYLRGIGQLEISLSHTGGLIVVGLSRYGRIGVDVEAADRPMLAHGTDRQMCVPAELRQLRCLPEAERNRALVRLWTLKEAYSKAIGQGMRFPFTEFGFDLCGGAPRALLLLPDGARAPQAQWAFHSRLVAGTHWVSGAFHDPGFGPGQRVHHDRALPPTAVHPGSSSR